ncbi:response regulator transcription factor [Pusillimonas sp. ANT_WB101]|uniref:response regulator transcription factor n=1 Tax=Pusillimonas sp. ANT_WB101 TaxID=2597356 RepID=UPI0011EE07A7|nr:response regulator [Pusillimonas sp. ANT_WB101]KAA0892670.1 response regulator transcription factor [Pusillimonas sp. ANT_WB101]
MTHPVYLVDDDEAVRNALCLLLSTVGVKVQGFADPGVFLAHAARLQPGCLIMDIRMPVISGLKLHERLAEQGIDWPTIIISGHGDIDACRRAFRNGAIDFLSKPIEEQDLIDAIQRGQDALDRMLRQRAEQAETLNLLKLLSPRECQVLEQVTQGFSTRQIADALGLSPRTVETHRASIGAKLGTTSQAELTRLWLAGQATP